MPIGSPGCVTRPRRSPPEARWISGAQGGGLTQRRAAVIRQVFDDVLLIRALLNERRRSESNRRIEVLQSEGHSGPWSLTRFHWARCAFPLRRTPPYRCALGSPSPRGSSGTALPLAGPTRTGAVGGELLLTSSRVAAS